MRVKSGKPVTRKGAVLDSTFILISQVPRELLLKRHEEAEHESLMTSNASDVG